MDKYNLEKQVKEQDRRLQLRDSLQDNSMSQLIVLENRCKNMVTNMDQMTQDQDRLQKNGNLNFVLILFYIGGGGGGGRF